MQYAFYPPSGGGSANASVGVNGAVAPTSSTEIGFINGSGNETAVSPSTPLPVTIDGGLANPLNVNVADWGGVATSLGQKLSAASVPVVLASDQSAIPISAASLPLPTGAATSANQTNGLQLTGLVAGSATIGSIANTSFIATQSSGANLHVDVDNFPATQPVSGTVTANQGTSPWVVSGTSTVSGTVTVVQPTGANLHVDVDNTVAISAASLPLPTGAATSANQTNGTQLTGLVAGSAAIGSVTVSNFPATQPVSGTVTADAGTPAPLTVHQDATTVGVTAVRCTVSGSAPASTRVALVVTPDNASTANFFIGSSTVTNSGATRGIEIAAGQTFIANNDAGDYWIVSSIAGQTVYFMEQY